MAVTVARPSNLVSTDWLAERLGSPELVVIDGSWHMPTAGRDAQAEFEAGHIPGAVFFDVDACVDQSSDLPHMLPSAAAFAAYAGSLGIGRDDLIVVYDATGLFSAARVWWTFRAFGAERVYVLDGGLPAWKSQGRALETGLSQRPAATFEAGSKGAQGVASIGEVRQIVANRSAQMIDARSAGRFSGSVAEPRAGLRSGHMPGALNVPFDTLIENGRLRSPQEIAGIFAAAGMQADQPVVTTCGSGVTAAVLTLALAEIGQDSRLYDGSWAEWGGHPETEVVTR